MLPTVFASYRNRSAAERLIGALLDAGIVPEDFSAVIKSNGQGPSVEAEEARMAMDAGQQNFPYFGHAAIQTEGSDIYESRIGGGISTSSPDDDVSNVEEMDDSEEVAEQLGYPDAERSFSSEDMADFEHGARRGFFDATATGRDGLGLDGGIDRTSFSRGDLSMVSIPHYALVLGDGALATSVLGAGVAAGVAGRPAAELQDYLEDEGVPKGLAFLLSADFEEGGAVVSVATPPGGLDPADLTRMFEENGARNVQLVEAVD